METQKKRVQISVKNNEEILVKGENWELTVDVTGGDTDLMVGATGGLGCKIIQVGEYTILTTEAEHYRGASRHNHHIYLIDKNGKIKWKLPWKITPIIRMYNGDLAILRHLIVYHYSDPMLEFCIVSPKNGKLVKKYPIHVPAKDKTIYETKRLSYISAHLKRKTVNVEPVFSISSGVRSKDMAFSWHIPVKLT